ncbi:MAG: hypothetical protein PHQ86_06680, partial [Dehalococcoidales bacterium]|nr:hypothetical protein [Dehalococcoidales bacterium]
MEKVCVFCGERPESKTLEHVIPRWLIEITGDPKRSAHFGFHRSDGGKFSKRIYSFDSFKFPACDECNSYFSSLEGKTKGIVFRLLSEKPLSESELSTLLDWFDKVRIGLWLGYMYLNNNDLGIEPHFYISNRIGLNDRMLLILKS